MTGLHLVPDDVLTYEDKKKQAHVIKLVDKLGGTNKRWAYLELAAKRLSHAEFHVLFNLVSTAGPELDRCFKGLQAAADDLGMSHTAVARAVGHLVHNEWITRDRYHTDGKRRSTHTTRFHVPDGVVSTGSKGFSMYHL